MHNFGVSAAGLPRPTVCAYRDLIVSVDDAGEPVLLRVSSIGNSTTIQKLCTLRRETPRPILEFRFIEKGPLVAATMDGYLQRWRLDEFRLQLNHLGLDWAQKSLP